ncbi:beta strand repeat-containing protein, partial [Arsenicibacter rosenii]
MQVTLRNPTAHCLNRWLRKLFYVLLAGGLLTGSGLATADAARTPEKARSACPTVIYVTESGGTVKNGSSWANAYAGSQFQQAINEAALCGSQVWVATGLYKPTATTSRTVSFSLLSGVAVYGSFPVGAASLADRNLTGAASTTLSGDIDNNNALSNNSYHVVQAGNVNNSTRLDGFVITGGLADGSTAADQQGGGMRLISSSAVVTNCSFERNQSTAEGGGIYVNGGSPQFTNSRFTGNSAATGGGMHQRGSSGSNVVNCIFSGNIGGTDGGGLYVLLNDGMTVSDCRFTSNTASVGAGAWEANYTATVRTVLTRCRFEQNTATNKGGGLYVDGLGRTVSNCLFAGNTAANSGGGTHIRNTNNTGTYFWNCIWTQNTAPVGAWVSNEAAGSRITNSIAWNNSVPDMGAAQSTYVFYSDIEGGFPGTGNTSLDPQFADAGSGDFRLTACSPGIDAGDAASTAADIGTTDLAGNVRVQGGRVDMGVYERTPALLPSEQQILYVSPSGGGAQDGSSWANAFPGANLQCALNLAGNQGRPMQVWVAAGFYTPASTAGRSMSIELRSNVSVYGSFTVGAGSLSGRDLTGVASTTLSGDIDNNNALSNNSYHVVQAVAITASRLDGFVLTGGLANGPASADQQGGGLRLVSSTVVVANCRFTGNQAAADGGGVFVNGGSPQFTDCMADNNTATTGAGMGHRISNGSQLTNCTFSENRASGDGGGFYTSQSNAMVVTGCRFMSNTAAVGAGMWEANYNVSARTSLIRSRFVNNAATNKGGGLFVDGAGRTVTNCLFIRNTAANKGGGVNLNNTGHPDNYFWNCVWSGNTAPVGAWVNNDNAGSRIHNAIAWNNSPSGMGTPDYTYVFDSDIQGGFTGKGNLAVDPLFADAANGDFRLVPCSPLIDRGGSDSDLSAVGSVDLAGSARVQGHFIDMGAYELTPVVLPVSQTIVYVSQTGSGTRDGSTWENAMPGDFLQCAINQAAGQGRPMDVWVTGGLYKPTTGTDQSASFQVASNVALYGGFVSGAVSTSARALSGPDSSTLSGDINGDGGETGSYHVVTALNVDNTARLDGFVITGARGVGNIYRGGGLQLIDSSPTIENCLIIDNITDYEGGGAYVAGGNPLFLRCVFQNNATTQTSGGGLFLDATVTQLLACTVAGNVALNNGGGISAQYSSYTITDTVFENNTAQSFFGGGLFSSEDIAPELTGCTFTGNHAAMVGGGISVVYGTGFRLQTSVIKQNISGVNGGGFASYMSDAVQLSGMTITSNTAVDGGGVWEANYYVTTPTVYQRSRFTANTATGIGGGLYVDGQNRAFYNCLMADNEAAVGGGGIYLRNTTGNTLTNCVLTQNTAPVGAWINNEMAGSTLTNCIVWHNSVDAIGDDGATLVNYSDVTGWAKGGTGNVETDPLFADAVNGNFQLTPCSPLINAGDPATTTATVGTVDLEGNTRLYESGSLPARIDMGAYEVQANPPVSLSPVTSSYTTCVSSPVGFTALAADGTTPYAYTWIAPQGSTLSNPSAISAVSATLTSAGDATFTMIVADANGCQSTTTISITALAAPSAALTALPALSSCAGTSITLVAADENHTSGLTYSWSTGESLSA